MSLLTIILVTIFITVGAVIVAQRVAIYLATIDTQVDWIAALAWRSYCLCDLMGWHVPVTEPSIFEALDRYGDDQAETPRITEIVVPNEYSRQQMMLALRYLHDGDIDTGYMAVNELVHCYTDAEGEPTGHTPMIVVRPDISFTSRVERAAKELERNRKSGYEWTDEEFEIWWTRDPHFVTNITSWPDGFRGTRKAHLMDEVEIILKAAGVK